MKSTPCDIHEYNSDEYNDCIKDIVYEAAQDEWIMLDPRFPNLKGITPERIDEFLADVYRLHGINKKYYYEDYLQHVMVYDRDDIIIMCTLLGEQIEKKYPGKLHSPHSIFITTPRGGHEVLSIFAYSNDLKKEQIPSHIRNINKHEQKIIERAMKHDKPGFVIAWAYGAANELEDEKDIKEAYEHILEGNLPIIPDIWLDTMSNYFRNRVKTIFIIDDIIASGEQITEVIDKIQEFFEQKIEIIPIVLVKRAIVGTTLTAETVFNRTLYIDETINIESWNEARELIKSLEKSSLIYDSESNIFKLYNSLITVRFPWGSPDGESDKILTSLYEGRRGLERIEKKRRTCRLTPDKCELK